MFTLPANGKCPKCGARILLTRYEPHPVKDNAYAYYDCEKCGPVMVKVIDIAIKPTK
jgi:DNA-directed RNA polymerase subunit RPC12/RpoP